MTWQEAIGHIRATDPHAWRWEQLCEDDSNPRRRDSTRAMVIRMAGGAPEYPSAVTMAGNLVKAAAGFVASGLALADDAEQARRLEVCRACEFFAADAVRCTKCGCGLALKARIAGSSCPTGRW